MNFCRYLGSVTLDRTHSLGLVVAENPQGTPSKFTASTAAAYTPWLARCSEGPEMKFDVPPDSLFATLLRSPWWVSAGISAVIAIGSATVVPQAYQVVGYFAAAPWLVIAAIAGWHQWRRPSAERIATALDAIRAMAWPEFSKIMQEAFRREGYSVSPLSGGAADFEIVRGGRASLVSGKRWKAARTGIEPLRELQAVREAREVRGSIYIFCGEITDTAKAFADARDIHLLGGAELVGMLPRAALKK